MTKIVLTYDDFAALPNDGRRYELHEGELSVTPAPSTDHQRTIGRLFRLLADHVERTGAGEVFLSPLDCILSNITVVEPDLVYIDGTRQSLVARRGIEGPPTLAVEVLSPSTTVIDRRTKMQLYAAHRVPYYWIVDIEARAIEAYHLREERYDLAVRLERSATALPPFPDLALDPASIWPAA